MPHRSSVRWPRPPRSGAHGPQYRHGNRTIPLTWRQRRRHHRRSVAASLTGSSFRNTVPSFLICPRHREVIAVATATTNLLNTPLEDPRVERVRRAALSAYVDGKITFAQANSRVRKAIERFHS